MESKQDIRKKRFALRKEVSGDELLEASRKILKQVTTLKVWKEVSWIYAYMDFKKEVMTRELIELAWKQGKQVAVPRVQGKDMTYCVITDFAQCEPGYFGIPEPMTGLPEAKAEDAFLIVPGVAFDRERHRVGYGQGFYDRYLSIHREHITAAVACEWQLVEQAPYEETDILPEYLITDCRIYH